MSCSSLTPVIITHCSPTPAVTSVLNTKWNHHRWHRQTTCPILLQCNTPTHQHTVHYLLCPNTGRCRPRPPQLNASITAVGAQARRCDENACFINFVTKSMHSIVQQDRQSSSRIPMKTPALPKTSQQNAGKNNSQLNLHHLSAHRLISSQVNNLLSALSYQVELQAC